MSAHRVIERDMAWKVAVFSTDPAGDTVAVGHGKSKDALKGQHVTSLLPIRHSHMTYTGNLLCICTEDVYDPCFLIFLLISLFDRDIRLWMAEDPSQYRLKL